MSRASAVRDAIVKYLKAQESLDCYEVEAFLVPDYTREELAELRIGVRVGGREIEIDPDGGPDERTVKIEVGVIGLTDEAEGITNKATYRQQQIEHADKYDEVMESIIDLWTPWGPLHSNAGMAEHYFKSIGQPQAFDARQLYENGVWVSMIELEYQDSRDEPE